MMIALHKNARTTPAIRAEIASSGDSAATLARRFGITGATVYKWKKRTSVHDASHTPHRLQTTLTTAQERVVVELRRTLLLPLDELLCAGLGIEHRLTKPRTPRTNGMVERFNGRIADVLRSHRFQSGQDLEQTLLRYVALYNHQFLQSALKSRTPIQAMKDWYAQQPSLFIKRLYDHPGCDM